MPVPDSVGRQLKKLDLAKVGNYPGRDGSKFKAPIAEYSGATGIVSSFSITAKSGSLVMKEHSHYSRIYAIDPPDLDATPRCIVGAVIL
jgi:hypothetical protein